MIVCDLTGSKTSPYQMDRSYPHQNAAYTVMVFHMVMQCYFSLIMQLA